jgi:hypothetical protein
VSKLILGVVAARAALADCGGIVPQKIGPEAERESGASVNTHDRH